MKSKPTAQVVFFLASACFIQSVSGDAPGDEHSLCLQDAHLNNNYEGSGHSGGSDASEVVLLDSYNYINLLAGVYPDTPVWTAQSYQRGGNGWTTDDGNKICEQSVRVCDYETKPGVNNWLFTQYIEYLDSKEVHIEVEYDLSACRMTPLCSQSYVSIYYHGTNGSCPEEQTDSTDYLYIGRFYWWSSTYTAQFNRPSSDEGFYLGFQDIGTCGTINRVRVFYNVCASKVDGLTSYPSLPLPPQDSQEPNIAYAYCAYNSYNLLASGYKAYSNGQCEYGARCECRLGYEEVTTGTDAICRACPRGQYRSALYTTCQWCPSNTIRTGRAVAVCPCVNNYYRTSYERPYVACTSPPSACRNLAVTSSTYNEITVTWDRPYTTGRYDFYYNIYYSSSEDDGNFTQHNRYPYYSRWWLYSVSYTLTGLNPFTSYTIRVTVHNGVSDQDPAGKANRQCEVNAVTVPSKVADFDMLSGLALWNPTGASDSTQYQIRYNRTEEGDQFDGTLNVYYIDNEEKYTIEVRPWSNDRLGSWSTPITVQFKAQCRSELDSEGSSSGGSVLYLENTSCTSTELFKSNYYYYYLYNFEDPCAVAIERIIIYYSSYVHSIQVTYKLTDGTIYTAPRRGYSSGRSITVYFNSYQDEEIVSITGGWDYSSRLTQLKFITMQQNGDHRVYGPYGSGSIAKRFVMKANVVSFFGRVSGNGRSINGLGFKYRPQC